MSTKTQPTQRSSTSVEREPLRWLFRAYFADGSEIEQDQADKSVTGNGTVFTDVLTKAKDSDLIAFELNHINGSERVQVDLLSGAFVMNDTAFHAHPQFFEPGKHELDLVYFRESRVDQVVNSAQEILSMRHYTNRYFIGWRANDKAKTEAIVAVG